MSSAPVAVTALPHVYEVEITHLLASSLHRYEGRPADGPRPAPTGQKEGRASIDVRAGLGIVGDRYFGHRAHRNAAVTVMAIESVEHVERELTLEVALDPLATRRNILLRGADVDRLRGVDFSLDSGAGAVMFRGHRPANPCAWMNGVLAEGAHRALRGRGGIRCEPLSDGTLALGPAVLRSAAPLDAGDVRLF
ncbi:MOSC domain-containing protein [Planctomonas psychrotolerans]|uniref:MOSC domain-containing protein n=1 Tax=Planctomonas psychrotolerans TaxID=2528712 RepID=UPI00123A6AAE|nr:MOSC domain-containing protein [Planctomonas psychrotolerans]